MKKRIQQASDFWHWFFVELFWKEFLLGIWEWILYIIASIAVPFVWIWGLVTFKWYRTGGSVPDMQNIPPCPDTLIYHERAKEPRAEGQPGGPPRPRPTPNPRPTVYTDQELKKRAKRELMENKPEDFDYEEALNRLRHVKRIKIVMKPVAEDDMGMVEVFEYIITPAFGDPSYWNRIGVGKTLEAAIKYAICAKA